MAVSGRVAICCCVAICCMAICGGAVALSSMAVNDGPALCGARATTGVPDCRT